jgi:hypothetical protein
MYPLALTESITHAQAYPCRRRIIGGARLEDRNTNFRRCAAASRATVFMIANKLDGAFSSFYTMGDRKYPQLRTYFENIRATMSSVAALSDAHTVIVQMVGFSEPKWQLPRYLRTMEKIGLQEKFLPSLSGKGDGRLWRNVPGRRWYSDQRGETSSSKEVVLLHVKRRSGLKY